MDNRTIAIPFAADPLTDMFARWVIVRREWENQSISNRDWDSPELAALSDEQHELFIQMMNTKATTLEGLLSQITLLWEQCGPTRIGVDPHEKTDPELRLKSQILQGAESLALASSWRPIDTKMTPASEF